MPRSGLGLALVSAVCLVAFVHAQDAAEAAGAAPAPPPCYINIGLPYETTEEVKADFDNEAIECTAAPIDCASKTFPDGSVEEQMTELCAEPSGGIFQTVLQCTGPTNPSDAECDVGTIPVIYGAAFEAANAAGAFADDKAACVTAAISIPYTFSGDEHFDLQGYGLNTMCEVAAGQSDMYCYGPEKVDCDNLAILGANVYAALESALGPLNNMPVLQKKYHIQNVLFWTITGTIFTWIGLIMVLYAEIKAVLIFRERDERERLVAIKVVKKNETKIKELESGEESYLNIRPYFTIFGSIFFWIGTLLQFTPLCEFITLIFPFWFGVENACYIVVLAATLFFAASLILILVGLIWSCTRGWAALVLLVLGIITNGLVFTGLIGLSIWLFFLIGFLLLWFKFLPDYFGANRPEWLQDIGNFGVAVSVDDLKKASEDMAKVAEADSKAAVTSLPGGKEALEAAERVKKEAEEKIKEATEAAEKLKLEAEKLQAEAQKNLPSSAPVESGSK